MKRGFVNRLRTAMDRAELKQAQLAEKIGAPRSAMSQYLAGKNLPGEERLEAMAQALGCSAGFLRGDEPDEAAERLPALPRKNISTAAAARCLGKSNQFIRVGLQSGRLPFGAAVPGGGRRFNYYISPSRLREFVGAERFDSFFNVGMK